MLSLGTLKVFRLFPFIAVKSFRLEEVFSFFVSLKRSSREYIADFYSG